MKRKEGKKRWKKVLGKLPKRQHTLNVDWRGAKENAGSFGQTKAFERSKEVTDVKLEKPSDDGDD